MNNLFDPNHLAAPAENGLTGTQPSAAPSDETFVPTLSFDGTSSPAESGSSDGGSHVDDFSPSFYGSYGEAAGDVPMTMPSTEPVNIPDAPDESVPLLPLEGVSSDSNDGFEDLHLPEDDLPPIPTPVADTRVKKSMGYETTVKLQNARHADKNDKPVNQPIRTGDRPNFTPKPREIDGIASGTAHISGGLPELRDDQMYVAITHKELRRLKSRRFRGLGVLATLCLVIIASYCVWSYANSFADPLVGRWTGNVNADYIPIEAIPTSDGELIRSTWEFSSSGSMYLNIVVNSTPISLSGTYTEQKDEAGEPYLAMVLTNPMDSTDYTFYMYYTVTGRILQFNDMEGMGMEINLTKE